MGIWNTGASPIGYAYQSAQGSGINIKPIDPRAFQVNSGSNPRTSSRSESDDSSKFDNKDVLSGTWTQLNDAKNYIDARLSSLNNIYVQKILNEKDSSKVKSLQDEYVKEMSDLSQQKSELMITNHNAKMQYLKHDDVNKDIQSRKIGSEYAIGSKYTGLIQDGNDIINMIQRGESPFQLNLKKENGKLSADLITYQGYQEMSDAYSGLQKDENGRIVSTTYNAPITKMNNSIVATEEIKKNVASAKATFNNVKKGGEEGSVKYDWEVGSNYTAINNAVTKSWELISEDTRAYALSSVLGQGLKISRNGKPDYIKGADAMLEIEKSMGIYNSKTASEAEKEKALKNAQYLSNAIVGNAKMYVMAIANDEASLYREQRTSDSKSLIRSQDGKVVGDKEISALEAMYAKLNTAGGSDFVVKNPNNGKTALTGPFDIKAMRLGTSDTQLIRKHVLDQEEGTKAFRSMASTAFGLVNGIGFRPDQIFANDPDAKIVDIGTELMSAPEFGLTPDKENGWQISTIKFKDATTPYSEKYIKVRAQASGATEIPIIDAKGKTVLKRIADLSDNEKQKNNINLVDTNEDATGIGLGADSRIWKFDMFIPAPSINATGGNNSINAYNLSVGIDNLSRSNTADKMQRQSDINIMNYKKNRIEVLSKAKDLDPSVKFIDSNNIAYKGNTPEELLASIQKNNNLDTRAYVDKKRLSIKAIMTLKLQGNLSSEDEQELLSALEKQPSTDKQKDMTPLELVNDLPFSVYRDMNDLGNGILNSIIK